MLPLGYTELEYLESTGTQYIDTGIIPDSSMKIELKAYQPDVNSIAGANPFIAWTAGSAGTLTLRQRWNNVQFDRYATPFEVHTTVQDRNFFYCDGNLVKTFTYAEWIATYSFLLFARNSSAGRPEEKANCKIYYASITKDSHILASFIPACRNSDGELGMYDTVTDTFFTNQGTGSFVAGPKVAVSSGKSVVCSDRLPVEYQEVEYIETHATEYIDTGVIPTIAKETDILLRISVTNLGSSYDGFGSDQNLNIVSTTVASTWRVNGTITNVTRVPNEVVDIELKQTSSGRYYKVKNEEGYGSITESPSSFLLGKLNSDKGLVSGYKFVGRYYGVSIKENDALVHNFIPCKKLSNNEYGLYDLVTKTFFGNSGTGAFTGGTAVHHFSSLISYKDVVVKKLLPEGYERVEYIESHGTEYIDTGITPSTTNFRFKFKAELLNEVRTSGVIGVTPPSGIYLYGMYRMASGNIVTLVGTSSNALFSNTTKLWELDFSLNNGTQFGTLNGTYVEGRYNPFTIADGWSLYLFAVHYRTLGTASHYSISRIYHLELYKNDVLVRNFIPCYIKATNEYGMYDLVSRQFFGNQGSGAFTGGPVIPDLVPVTSYKSIIKL